MTRQPAQALSKVAAALLLTAFAAPAVVMTAQAADQTSPPAKAAPQKPASSAEDRMKVSEAGREAIQFVRMARFDIFNGDPKASMAALSHAKTQLTAAEKEAKSWNVGAGASSGSSQQQGNGPAQTAPKAIPVDGQLILADSFTATPENKKTIAKANSHLKKGDQKAALEALRQGAISINYLSEWIPLAPTSKNLDKAIALEKAGKYYEANLALKAIEDSMFMETVTIPAPPVKGTKAQNATPEAAK
jgi:hypothetical protein